MFKVTITQDMYGYYTEQFSTDGIEYEEDSLQNALKTAKSFIEKGFAVAIEIVDEEGK